jgi:hypothetical protein
MPPTCPPDRTHIYHKFRIRLDTSAWGYDVAAERFRDVMLKALAAEGVEVATWQTRPLPGQTLFTRRDGYGHGCPWTCHGSTVTYDADEFPETKKLLADSILVGSESYPLFPQDRSLLELYVKAFHKVWESRKDLSRLLAH